MPLTFEQYISEFGELDEYGDLAERLKEELHDHFDDSVHAFMICGTKENEAEQKAFQNLGESKKIIHEFKTVMKFNNKISLWLESLFLGVISIPVYHCVFFLFILSIENYMNEFSGFQIVTRHIFGYIITFLFLGIFYFINTGRLFRFIDKKKHLFSLSIGIFLPIYVFAWAWSDWGGGSAFLAYFLYTIFPGMIMFSLLVHYAFKKKKEIFGRKQAKERKIVKIWTRIREWLAFFMSCFFILIILVSNKNFVGMDSSYNRSVIDFITFLRNIFESINLPILDFHINGAFGGYEGFYILAGIYIFLAFVSLYKIGIFLFEKTAAKRFVDFPWLRLTLLVYIFSLFFLVQVPEKANIKWEVPLRNISSEIKHEQLGMLYRFGTYFSHVNTVFQKSFYLYEITKNDTAVIIRVPDNEGMPHEYILAAKNNQRASLNSLKSLNDFELSKVREDAALEVGFYHGPKELPTGVECVTEEGTAGVYSLETGPQPAATLDTNLFYKYCHKLSYNGKLIYTQEEANRLYQFEIFSENPRFAIVRIETGEYGPQEVYLVDLR